MFHSVAICLVQLGNNAKGGSNKCRQDDYDFWQHGKGAQADKLKLALNKGRGVHEYIDSDKEETPKSGKSEPAMVAAYPFSSDPLQQVRERPASINSQQGICQAFPKVDGRLLDLMLKSYLPQLDKWDFNVLCFNDLTRGRPLAAVVAAAMDHFNLYKHFSLLESEVHSCMELLEGVYRDNPYHNRIHAADVTQSMCAVLESLPAGGLAPHETLALVLGAAMHDAGHPGKSNNYLAVTGAPEYQQHPVSPNEHCHVEAWELLLQHTNLTAPLSAATLEKILHIIRKAVCLTDMAKHFELLEQFKACVDKLGPDTSLWQAPEERDTLLSFLLHACDISNGLRALLLAADWAKRITLENCAEGDALGRIDPHLVTKPFDRTKLDLPGSQVFFLSSYLIPTFQQLARIAPKVSSQALATGRTNLAKWSELQQRGVTTLEAAAQALHEPYYG